VPGLKEKRRFPSSRIDILKISLVASVACALLTKAVKYYSLIPGAKDRGDQVYEVHKGFTKVLMTSNEPTQ
jgi:hypothetical protein